MAKEKKRKVLYGFIRIYSDLFGFLCIRRWATGEGKGEKEKGKGRRTRPTDNAEYKNSRKMLEGRKRRKCNWLVKTLSKRRRQTIDVATSTSAAAMASEDC